MNNFGFVCLALMVCYCTAVTPQQKSMIQSKILTVGLDCVKQYPLSLTEIRTFRNKMIPDQENSRCFAACLFKKVGIMNDMGKLDAEKVAANAKEIFMEGNEHIDKAQDFIKECSKVNEQSVSDGEKGCDRAKLAFDCLRDNAPKYGFDIDF